MLAGILNVSPTWILTGRGEAPLVDEEGATGDSRRGLLNIWESIRANIDELKQVLDEADDMIETRNGP